MAVSVSVRTVPEASWARRAGDVRVSGDGQDDPDGRGRRGRPPVGAAPAPLLTVGDPVQLRLVDVDALAGRSALRGLLDALPA